MREGFHPTGAWPAAPTLAQPAKISEHLPFPPKRRGPAYHLEDGDPSRVLSFSSQMGAASAVQPPQTRQTHGDLGRLPGTAVRKWRSVSKGPPARPPGCREASDWLSCSRSGALLGVGEIVRKSGEADAGDALEAVQCHGCGHFTGSRHQCRLGDCCVATTGW